MRFRLEWYVLKENFAPFFLSLILITFLFVIDFLLKLLDAILAKGLNFWVILEIFVLNLAWMLALSIPMSCLIATLLTFGRLSGDSELTAMRSCGVSPFRVLLPVLLLSIGACLGLIYFNNHVLPEANHRAASLRSDITRKNAPAFITPRMLIKDFPNYRLWIDSIDYHSYNLFGIKIYSWEGSQPPRYLQAATGDMQYTDDGTKIVIRLFDGENHIVDNKDVTRYLKLKFNTQQVAIENIDTTLVRRDRYSRTDREMPVSQMWEIVRESESQKKKYREDYESKIFADFTRMDSAASMLNLDDPLPQRLSEADWWKAYPVSSIHINQLKAAEREKQYWVKRYISNVESENQQINKYLVEIHKKYSIPFACIVFVIVGGSLGILSRRGSIGIGSVLSALFIMVYWVCLLGGESLADDLKIPSWFAMWSPNIVVGFIGLFLLHRATRLHR